MSENERIKKSEFVKIFEQIQKGLPANLEFEAEGDIYERGFHPKERLILLGGGHIAQPLCSFASVLGFAVTVVDDRPDFASYARFPEAEQVVCNAFSAAISTLNICERDYVAVITRGHRWDADCLRAILPGTMPKYLGMIGSKRRVRGLLNLLEQEGISRERLNAIHTPIGLSIGALTIQEIAISIVAELIQCRREGTNRRAKGTLLVSQDIDRKLLEFITQDNEPKVLLVVYETSGSTPVKSGAMMAVDKNFQMAGTIGGGCSENAIMRTAVRMVGTGKSQCINVDMSNDIAEEEGMVCGGQMEVLVTDLLMDE